MTPQEAYIKGLDDAENRIIANINNYLEKKDHEPFANPVLEEAWKKLIDKKILTSTVKSSEPEFYSADKIREDKEGLKTEESEPKTRGRVAKAQQ